MLDRSLGSFKGFKDDRRDSDDKTWENRKSGLKQILPAVSFNEKLLQQSQRKPSAVFRLSFKRRSCEREETIEHCKYPNYLFCL